MPETSFSMSEGINTELEKVLRKREKKIKLQSEKLKNKNITIEQLLLAVAKNTNVTSVSPSTYCAQLGITKAMAEKNLKRKHVIYMSIIRMTKLGKESYNSEHIKFLLPDIVRWHDEGMILSGDNIIAQLLICFPKNTMAERLIREIAASQGAKPLTE